MHAISNNQIADILRFNDNAFYKGYLFYLFLSLNFEFLKIFKSFKLSVNNFFSYNWSTKALRRHRKPCAKYQKFLNEPKPSNVKA